MSLPVLILLVGLLCLKQLLSHSLLRIAFSSLILILWNVGTIYQNISVLATDYAPGQALCMPYYLHIDVRNGYKLYFSDYCYCQVLLYTNLQSASPPPRSVAGGNNSGRAGLQRVNAPFGIQVDSHYNVIDAAMDDHRITFWPPNATNGTVIAGLCVASSTSMGLNCPGGIALDERSSLLYVADIYNHRIQRYSLNGTWPCNGKTVADGNGAGSGSHQLSTPCDIWIWNKTGTIYIVDSGNRRIKRWEQGATTVVTIAGDPNGISGTDATQRHDPTALAINANKTYMYVTDTSNNRVQRFQLI